MKQLLLILFMGFLVSANAQNKLIPAKNLIEKKWLKNQIYEMSFFALNDTVKFEIGKVHTEIINDNNRLTVITKVQLKQQKNSWTDTTIATIKELKPIYHSSYNAQRDMVLKFGEIVSGYYYDKMKKTTVSISDTTTEDYFDSNLYPALIAWLPLKQGYQQTLSIYDYNPNAKSGVQAATIQQVKKGTLATQKNGIRNVWIVSVRSEIGGSSDLTTYYVDIENRKTWKQEIETGNRKMLMEIIE